MIGINNLFLSPDPRREDVGEKLGVRAVEGDQVDTGGACNSV